MTHYQLAIVWRAGTTSLAEVADQALGCLKQSGYRDELFHTSRGLLDVTRFREHVVKSRRNTFGGRSERTRIDYSGGIDAREDLLRIRMPEEVNLEDWFQQLFSAGDVTQAFIVNEEYYRWQNAKDPIEFEAAGRSHTNLPKVSNGLPPPLEKLIVDTSTNPGRFRMCHGFIEIAASPMWLGEHFWTLTGANQVELESIPGLNISRFENLIRLAYHGGPFADESSAKQQNALRSALYPNH